MSTSVLETLPGKLDIKRHSPSILYFIVSNQKEYIWNGWHGAWSFNTKIASDIIHMCVHKILTSSFHISIFDCYNNHIVSSIRRDFFLPILLQTSRSYFRDWSRLTLLYSEWPILYGFWPILSVKEFRFKRSRFVIRLSKIFRVVFRDKLIAHLHLAK